MIKINKNVNNKNTKNKIKNNNEKTCSSLIKCCKSNIKIIHNRNIYYSIIKKFNVSKTIETTSNKNHF